MPGQRESDSAGERVRENTSAKRGVGNRGKDKLEADLSLGSLICSCFCCVRRKGCSRSVANSGRATLPLSQSRVRRRWASKLFCIAVSKRVGGRQGGEGAET